MINRFEVGDKVRCTGGHKKIPPLRGIIVGLVIDKTGLHFYKVNVAPKRVNKQVKEIDLIEIEQSLLELDVK